MNVDFSKTDIPEDEYGRIDEVLDRIKKWEKQSQRDRKPEKIDILRILDGGRGASRVLEVDAITGSRRTRKVVKIGPYYNLHNEFKAFDEHLQAANALFVPIHAATPALNKKKPAPNDKTELQAVVYDHGARFHLGQPDAQTTTFEQTAREAINTGVDVLDRAVAALQTLFDGVRNNLYDKHENKRSDLREAWNRRLGFDAVIAIDEFDPAGPILKTRQTTPHGKSLHLLYPRDIAELSASIKTELDEFDLTHLINARMAWWGDDLIAEIDNKHLRLKIVADGGETMRQIAPAIRDGQKLTIDARIHSRRPQTHRDRLINGLNGSLNLAYSQLEGKNAITRDPFAALAAVLDSPRDNRYTALAHGDLNPRNILLVADKPCLIDYEFTAPGQPILMDFACLEGSLARDVLPPDLTWAQHVRLQRLLAATCHWGDDTADRLASILAAERPELANAFRLFWTIRKAARDVFPDEAKNAWARDYLEQLFLFAHQSLKWDDQSEPALRATAAMAGVAAEAFDPANACELWSDADMHADAPTLLATTNDDAPFLLSNIAGIAKRLTTMALKPDAPLWTAFTDLRHRIVRRRFHDNANEIMRNLQGDHDVFIHLKAYIDLKGTLKKASRRARLGASASPDDILMHDTTLAERERLRTRDDAEGDDVLALIAARPAVVLLGDAGAGKSTVAREWRHRLASAVLEGSPSTAPAAGRPQTPIEPRLPIVILASVASARLDNWDPDHRRTSADVFDNPLHQFLDLLDAGACAITIDALNELTHDDRQDVAKWIKALCRDFPLTPVVVCHRQYNWIPGLLPFPVITLQSVAADQARQYICRYLREKKGPSHEEMAESLIRLLLDDPEYINVRELAQTPLFLWMIVERYRKTGKPPVNRARLFDDFSKWYLEQRHHARAGDQPQPTLPYADKALLLGALGYELVRRRKVALSEKDVAPLVPDALKNHWPQLLDEIIDAQMLNRDDEQLRFLHQSFQEYFAARRFLEEAAENPDTVRDKVIRFGWHDTFALLLGFSGDRPEVARRVIDAALQVNPTLTARCLRMAERIEPDLLAAFVADQDAVLRNQNAGDFAHPRAAQALFEYGRGPARRALWAIALDDNAPETSRIESLARLADMPAHVRFETVADKIRKEFIDNLPTLFDSPASVPVQKAAIEAIQRTRLTELSAYLTDLIQGKAWPLSRAAYEACQALDRALTPNLRTAFASNCRKRLDRAEKELYQETVVSRMNELNAERVMILRQLASPADLPLLLTRRFAYRINGQVAKILDNASKRPGEPPEEAQQAWTLLTEETAGRAKAIARWIQAFQGPDAFAAAVAAHHLCDLGSSLPVDRIRNLLDPDLAADRLPALASIAAASQNKSLAAPLENLIRPLIYSVTGPPAVEALCCLIAALEQIDSHRANRLAAVASMVFFADREDETAPGRFPWRSASSGMTLDDSDYQALLKTDDTDARAATFVLSSYGGAILFKAAKNSLPTRLDPAAHKRLCDLAIVENDPLWRSRFARAAAPANATILLRWVREIAALSKTETRCQKSWHPRYGLIAERHLAVSLRVIGYLARRLLDNNQPNVAKPAIDDLRQRYVALKPDTERSIVVGLTTGLGFLGHWQPILTRLGPEQPWMHEAARNVFENWVPGPLAADPEAENERAAAWIARRLRDKPALHPKVRATLDQILDDLEQKLGRHITPD